MSYRFGVFEGNTATGELRRKGMRVKVPAQSFQILIMLLERPGELVTREEICRELWPDGTFVDYEHGINSAINRLRETLGDKASSPRFIETLSRRGYRFVAPVKRIEGVGHGDAERGVTAAPEHFEVGALGDAPQRAMEIPTTLLDRVLARPEDLPNASHRLVRTLFVLLQLMYVGFYVGTLANLAEVDDLLAPLAAGHVVYRAAAVSAVLLIPVRVFLLCAVLFRPPRFTRMYLSLWPFLMLADLGWAMAPFLLLHHLEVGVALACVPFLVYSPLAQRSLVLMLANEAGHEGSGSEKAPAVKAARAGVAGPSEERKNGRDGPETVIP